MKQENSIYEKIMESIKTIFLFSIARTNNREEAEDLSQDIISELFRSSGSLRDEKAFYGWMWAVANNVYKGYLRRLKKEDTCCIDENTYADFSEIPELKLVQCEELNLLRRELSLLSERYRTATIKYYIENKSCLQISEELKISIDMVKYLLFKARKLLKEGINMAREYGEKSYNPGVFNIDCWTIGSNSIYWQLFSRRLPGNILLSAYYTPLTIEEISLELGVSAPYLEDEISILLKHNLIKQLQNGRYQTNIIILTKSCEDEINEKTKGMNLSAEKLNAFIKDNEEQLRSVGFYGCDFNKNRFLWITAHIALWKAMNLVEAEFVKNSGGYPLLSNGSHGYIWGINRNHDAQYFNGIYGKSSVDNWTSAHWLHTCNYKIIENCQYFKPSNDLVSTIIKVANNEDLNAESEKLVKLIAEGYIINDNGSYKTNFPVFTEAQYNRIVEILEPIITEISKDMKASIFTAAQVLENHAPAALKDQCNKIAQITQELANMGIIMESMCENGFLCIPKTSEKLAMFVVLK